MKVWLIMIVQLIFFKQSYPYAQFFSLPNWFSPIIILFQFLLNSIIAQISINTNAQKQKRNKTILPFLTIKLLSL